ncbi:dual specificity protein phosphatase 1 isoform X2 [Cornus florida]|uniref:dual specificity protein phosphatase 1 isoform X2 n=1 Tax=Cornus florida TaxID=4283 RepID=UPI0028978DE6|nr:dual specificity protein phosphatase 1 isoform X2 [Cornus florida]
MDRIDETRRDQIAALWRAVCATKFNREDNVPCQIEEGLFLGSVGAANNKNVLKSLNVTHILTVANSLAPAHPNDFIYKIIDVPDRESINIAQYFDECYDFIDEANRMGGGVLVHCFVGKSRSVTMVVAYLMKKHGMNMSRALEHVKSRRPLASPNSGFVLQLQNFEKALQACRDQNMKDT